MHQCVGLKKLFFDRSLVLYWCGYVILLFKLVLNQREIIFMQQKRSLETIIRRAKFATRSYQDCHQSQSFAKVDVVIILIVKLIIVIFRRYSAMQLSVLFSLGFAFTSYIRSRGQGKIDLLPLKILYFSIGQDSFQEVDLIQCFNSVL